MKSRSILTILATSITLLASAQRTTHQTTINPFDPMLDGKSQIQHTDQGPKWASAYMWHPGQLAAWKQADNLARSRERCVNVDYPGSYYRMSTTTQFRTTTRLRRASRLEWRASGPVRVTLDGTTQQVQGESCKIPSGTHTLEIQVTTQSRLPALIVRGAGLEDDARWTASTDGTHWSPVESDARLCHPGVLPDESRELLVSIATEDELQLHDGQQKVIDFHHLELGIIRMQATGHARLAFTVGETADEARNTWLRGFEQYALDTITVDGQRDITLPERALRYLCITALGGDCTIRQLRFDAEMWPVEYQMDFECDDEQLNQIFQASMATLHTCMHNFYLDGVKRDFLPWGLDAVLSSVGANFAFGEQQLTRNAISIALMPENATLDDLGVIDYPLHALLGLQQEYMRYGDLRTSLMFQRRIISQMQLFMSMQDEHGFISAYHHRWGFIPGWNVHNGPEHNSLPAYAQMLLMENFRIAARFATLWEMPQLAETYTQRAQQLEKSIRATFWDADRRVFINGILPDGRRDERISHHTLYWSVLTGLYPAEHYQHLFCEVYPTIPRYLDNVSFEKGYEAIAFARAGYTAQFVDIMKSIFGRWLQQGHTRFPENFLLSAPRADQLQFYNRPYGLSLCHGANGVGAITAIIYGLFGFQQDMDHPGHYTLRPRLHGLHHMRGHFTVREGRISVQVRPDGTVHVDAPKQCSVTVVRG